MTVNDAAIDTAATARSLFAERFGTEPTGTSPTSPARMTRSDARSKARIRSNRSWPSRSIEASSPVVRGVM